MAHRPSHRQSMPSQIDQTLYDPRLSEAAFATAVQTQLRDRYQLDIGHHGADGKFGGDSRAALKQLSADDRAQLLVEADRDVHPERHYKALTDPALVQDGNFVMRIQQKLGEASASRDAPLDLGNDGPNGDGVSGKYNPKTDAALMQLSDAERKSLLDDARADADVINKSDPAFLAKQQQGMDAAFAQLPATGPKTKEQASKELKTRFAKTNKPETKTTPAHNTQVAGGSKPVPAGIAKDALSAQPSSVATLDPKRTAYLDYKTGRLYTPDGKSYAAGAGKGAEKNDFTAANQRSHGPIPEGVWSVASKAPNNYHMANGTTVTDDSFRLAPAAGTNTQGRGGFLIHPEHSQNYQSIGCVAVDRSTIGMLDKLKKSGQLDNLVVTRDMDALKAQMQAKNGFGAQHSALQRTVPSPTMA